jgi:hypothetical protein
MAAQPDIFLISIGGRNFSSAYVCDFFFLAYRYESGCKRQLEALISRTRHFKFVGYFPQVWIVVNQLVSPTLSLESLSLSCVLSSVVIPDAFLNCTTPNLTTLELKNCDISWKSPLLKGLRTLQISHISTEARPTLDGWLDALNEMPNLKTLSLQHATPLPDKPAHSYQSLHAPSHFPSLPISISKL